MQHCAWCGDLELHVSVDVLFLIEAPCLAKGVQWKSVVCSVIAHVTTRVVLPESRDLSCNRQAVKASTALGLVVLN